MVVSSSIASSEDGGMSPRTSKKEANALLVTVSALLALLAKKTSRLTRKSSSKEKTPRDSQITLRSPRSPLAKPKQLLNTLSNKAITFVNHHHKKKNDDPADDLEWGDGGVWQKSILMGDKCQPLDFSGVIYYDSNGNQLEELPIKSPRASPIPGYLTRY